MIVIIMRVPTASNGHVNKLVDHVVIMQLDIRLMVDITRVAMLLLLGHPSVRIVHLLNDMRARRTRLQATYHFNLVPEWGQSNLNGTRELVL